MTSPQRAGLLHHVELYVSDLERSLELWSWFLSELGYTCVSKWSAGQSWQLGETSSNPSTTAVALA